MAWNRDPREIKTHRRAQSAGAQSAVGMKPVGEAATYTHTRYFELQKPVLEKWAQLIRDAADRVPASDASNVHQLSFGQPAAGTA